MTECELKAFSGLPGLLAWAKTAEDDAHLPWGDLYKLRWPDGHSSHCHAFWNAVSAKAYTDAALIIAEATLPVPEGWVEGAPPSTGWKIGFYRGIIASGQHHCVWEAMIRPHGEKWGYDHSGPTPALAIIRALLRALDHTVIQRRVAR